MKLDVKMLKENFERLNMKQKMSSFDLAWEGKQLPGNRLINKFKEKLPGVHYKKIYSLINKIVVEPNPKDVLVLEKELMDFYSFPLTERHKKYYTIYKQEIKDNLNPINKTWLLEKILLDLQRCEVFQRNRALKRYGLIYDEKILKEEGI